jgi:hypothetical protein
MAVRIKFLLTGEDRGQPLNPEDFGVNITEESSINSRIISFENELIFGGDVFGYLYGKVEQGDFCELIETSVLYECKDGWKKLVDGYIIITECKFDIDKCTVRTTMYDETFSTKINNNKTIPFYNDSNITKNLQPVVPPSRLSLFLFTPSNGQYILNYNVQAITVYDAFKHLVACMSDNLVDFESDYFKVIRPNFDIGCTEERKTLVLTSGLGIRKPNTLHVAFTFEQLFTALNRKLRLGMGFYKQNNGRPLLRIENADYFFEQNRSCELYDQPGIEMLYDREQLIASIRFGADPFFEKFECNDGNTPCSFLQTPFRGFKTESFGILGTCNTERQLDLETTDVIFDTNIIEDILIYGNLSYDDNPVIMSVCVNRGLAVENATALQYDPLGDSSTIYNGNLINSQVASNWIGGYPNSLWQYLQGFNPAETPFNARYNGFPVMTFDIIEDTFTSYAVYTGTFLTFNQILVNANGNYNTIDTYNVPYAGVYTFNYGVTLDGINEPVGRRSFITLKQYDLNDVFLGDYNSPVVLDTGFNTVINIRDSIIIACNQGDKIRVDISVCTQNSGTVTSWQQDIIPSVTVGPVTDFTEFIGSGVPFGDTGLQPVNPNDVRTVLYRFKRPLTMLEIESILSNTSAPIGLGNKSNATFNIDTYIKQVQIESVIRQNATFELRSKNLLS